MSVHGVQPAGLGLVLVQLLQQVLVLESNLPDGIARHGHQFRGEIHGSEGGKQRSVLQHAERRAEIEPQVVGRETHDHRFLLRHHVEDAFQTFGKGRYYYRV